MNDNKTVDMAHISFLNMINVMLTVNTAANTKGTLIRIALNTAEKLEKKDYASMEEFVAAINDVTNPITTIEGKARQIKGSLFALPNCPFASSIRDYKKLFEQLPAGYAEFTTEFNKTSKITNDYRIGEGAGVSPFCAVHQPLRSAIGEKITIGGKKIAIYQLGCKSSGGAKGLADKWLAETGVSPEEVDKILDDNMCCYYIKVMP